MITFDLTRKQRELLRPLQEKVREDYRKNGYKPCSFILMQPNEPGIDDIVTVRAGHIPPKYAKRIMKIMEQAKAESETKKED